MQALTVNICETPDIWPREAYDPPDRPEPEDDDRDEEERLTEFFGGGDDEQADRFP